MKIQQRNKEVKQDNKILLEKFYDLQQRLFTDSFDMLTKEEEERIDLLYEYFKQRNSSVQSLLAPNQSEPIPKIEEYLAWKL